VVREFSSIPGNYELTRLINTLAPDLILLDLDSGRPAFECAARIHGWSPRTAVIGYGGTPGMQHAVHHACISTVVAPHGQTEDLRTAIREALELQQGGVERFLYCFLPSKAGSGASTIVLNTAAAMARLGKRVLVIDADLRSGIQAIMLGVESGVGLQAALQRSVEIDQFVWRNCVVQAHGVDFLMSSRSLDSEPPEWSHYYQLLNFASGRYDAILVDLPELVNPATIEVVRRSRMIFPVCTPEIPSLKLTIHRCLELKRLAISDERIGILVNRWHATDPAPAQIAAILGKAILKAFPNDYAEVHAAIAAGRPVPAASRPGKVYSEFAARLVEQVIATEQTFSSCLKGLLGLASA